MVPDRLVFRTGDFAGVRVRRGFRARLVLQIRNQNLIASSVPPAPGKSLEWRENGFGAWRDVDANNPVEVSYAVESLAGLFPEQTRERSRITE